ncbi:MAG: hypothetical protein LLF90_05030 [Methanomicrobiaceae archaeon]|uniref:hypothetical protein n=1 Tax=Methanoculleus sp. TaxID=90427 RepID=UPI00320C736B|nr:hypothetical protein [Methanomicrobiaceae archaeon]
MTDNELEPFTAERLFDLISGVESATRNYETARLELEFIARGIKMISRHYTLLSDEMRADLQDIADDIQRRLNRGSNPVTK